MTLIEVWISLLLHERSLLVFLVVLVFLATAVANDDNEEDEENYATDNGEEDDPPEVFLAGVTLDLKSGAQISGDVHVNCVSLASASWIVSIKLELDTESAHSAVVPVLLVEDIGLRSFLEEGQLALCDIRDREESVGHCWISDIISLIVVVDLWPHLHSTHTLSCLWVSEVVKETDSAVLI